MTAVRCSSRARRARARRPWRTHWCGAPARTASAPRGARASKAREPRPTGPGRRPSARSASPPPDLAAGSRTRLFDEVAELVRDAAGPGLLLVLDDLHRADPSSLSLLQVVAAEAPDVRLLLVGLYRGPEAPAALRRVLRGRACSPMVLGGLTPAETGRLAADELGRELTDRDLAGLRERSGGNPLFLLELLRLRKATGDTAGLPSGVRDVIEQRAGRLGPAAAEAVRRAAVLGREFPLAVFTGVTGEPPEALDEAVAAGLVRVDSAGRPGSPTPSSRRPSTPGSARRSGGGCTRWPPRRCGRTAPPRRSPTTCARPATPSGRWRRPSKPPGRPSRGSPTSTPPRSTARRSPCPAPEPPPSAPGCWWSWRAASSAAARWRRAGGTAARRPTSAARPVPQGSSPTPRRSRATSRSPR
ncbi:AAA family ATPase [Actinomadura sp. LD22]|uniref:AAA family ATPase n=1 Tax=Actinomadura physcomitrii TaxID=2650748 RepID=A0A6I4MIF9_9ACTN|nr:AAA family ATPase [Actinomadura physcomitrii]